VSVPTKPPRPASSGKEKAFTLGCGRYEAYIVQRGTGVGVGTLEFTGLDWSRSLDAVSSASLTIDGISDWSKLAACCLVLRDTRPWQHELAIYRNSKRVWTGPIVKLTYPPMQAQVDAQDRAAWLAQRFVHQDHDWSGSPTDLMQIAVALIGDALAPDPSPNLLLDVAPLKPGQAPITGERQYLASDYALASVAIDELTQTALDWTVIDWTMRLGTKVAPISPAPQGAVVPRLFTQHFATTPSIVVDGTAQRTLAVVKGSSQTGVVGLAGGVSNQFGLLEDLTTNDQILDQASANQAAQSRLDEALTNGVYDDVAFISGGTLTEDAPITIDQLVPGARIEVRIDHVCYPVLAQYRLGSVKVTSDAQGERVDVTFIPIGTETATEPQ
jgi:hypothetical protein